MKSLDTIIREYQENPFFKIKLDMMLRKLEEPRLIRLNSDGEKKAHKTDTLKSSIGKSNMMHHSRLMEIKARVEALNHRK